MSDFEASGPEESDDEDDVSASSSLLVSATSSDVGMLTLLTLLCIFVC